jgi:hypothetical protein
VSSDESGGYLSLQVTANCAQALRRLRLTDYKRGLWVDAICIDQHNDHERSAQLKIMQRIYRAALQVIIYLGETYCDSNRAITILEEEVNGHRPLITDTLTAKDICTLRDFLARPWFARVWVLQEVAYAWSGVVVCGQRSTSWSRTFSANFTSSLAFEPGLRPFPHVMSFGPSWLNGNTFTSKAFFNQLCVTRECGATDPKDKVYAILSLFRSVPKSADLAIDYTRSTADIFTGAAAFLLQSIGPIVLSEIYGRSFISNLPSWVPDWTVQLRGRPPRLLHHALSWSDILNRRSLDIFPSQPYIQRGPSGVIKVEAICLDTVHSVGRAFEPGAESWESVLLSWMDILDLDESQLEEEMKSAREEMGRRFLNVIYLTKEPQIHNWRALRRYCLALESGLKPIDARWRAYEAGDVDPLDWTKAMQQSAFRCQLRRLFRSHKLRCPGLGSNEIREGDSIFQLRCASQLPICYVLRPNGNYFSFVGDCYFTQTKCNEVTLWERVTMH